MNINRGNNRRRGRGNGNNNRQGGGNGQQLNRIDSRARGNAPQMLEKYRKLAHDAHLNGDRVMEEYYLQFADHYFRVIADTRVRQEEQRARRDDRWQEGGEEAPEENEFSAEAEYQPYARQSYERPVREERAPREDRAPRDDRGPREDRAPREARPPREERAPRPPRVSRDEQSEAADLGNDGGESPSVYEPAENPFVREDRGTRGLRPRRDDRRPRRAEQDEAVEAGAGEGEPSGFDASVLPPSIATPRDDSEPAAPRRRGRPPRAKAVDAAE